MGQDRVGLKQEFIDRLMSCDWFCNCGDKIFDQFEVVIEENRKKAIAYLSSSVWEGICLEKRGDLAFAIQKLPSGNNDYTWNNVVKEIQLSGHLGRVSKRIKAGLKKRDISSEEILVDARANVLSLFVANYFSEYYTDEFYGKMLQIYLSGHLPCGYEHNKFRVY